MYSKMSDTLEKYEYWTSQDIVLSCQDLLISQIRVNNFTISFHFTFNK